MLNDKDKASINAPCLFDYRMVWRGNLTTRKVAPTVDCDGDCGNCGWNDEVHKTRMARGWKKENGLWQLKGEKDAQ